MLSEDLYDMGVLNGGNQHYSIYQKHYHHHTIKQPIIHETITILLQLLDNIPKIWLYTVKPTIIHTL